MPARTLIAKPKRVLDAQRTRAGILAAAHDEFVEHGLSGARVDAIADRTATTKRMIYYYFISKDGLFTAVLERAYAGIRSLEPTLDLNGLSPTEALRRLTEFTFDYHADNPDFVRLVQIENIHFGRHVRQSSAVNHLNSTVITLLADILTRGHQNGSFQHKIAAVDLHMLMSAICFYRVGNRHTFGHIFNIDLADPTTRASHHRLVTNAVLRMVGVA